MREIRGFQFLKILFYYNAGTLQLLVRIWSNRKCVRERQYSNLFKKLEKWIPDDYTIDVNAFCRKIRNTRYQLPLGTRISPIDRGGYKLSNIFTYLVE